MSSERSSARRPEDAHAAGPYWERSCVEQMERGKPEAFNRLVEYYSARIYAHLYRMMRNREEAEDATQETFIRAYRKIGSYDRTRPFRNWLYTIATNVGRNATRSRGRRIPSARTDPGTETSLADDRSVDLPESRELKDWLVSAVDRLPGSLPLLIQLHYQEGLTIREAAGVLGMSEGAAKVALHRARKRLRTMLEKDRH
ncbi:MAG: sigma-70 family RNA polymerase sigma factor [Anaerolineales bacterium]|nr:sigma-70 family RNA polymerase sigma factor [Anaerolineales bacterium]